MDSYLQKEQQKETALDGWYIFFSILCRRNLWGQCDTLLKKYLGSGEMLIP